jgi:outer membrane protein OmpA-like peptidoglycan-associated protein
MLGICTRNSLRIKDWKTVTIDCKKNIFDMAKGVKKLKWTGEGTVKSNLSIPNRKVTIDPDQYVWFTVGEWDEGVSEVDKRKSLTWMLQDKKAKTIIKQKELPAGNKYGLKLSKNLCGSFEYYIEASLSGNRDLKRETGLIVSGFCEPKITTSKWCTTNDADDVRKSHVFSYGEAIYLNIETEGLNGSKNLIVDIFRHENLKTDPLIFTYTRIDVIDGEINLAMLNTFSWYGKIKGIKEDEEFYVKIKDASTGKYIVDSHNDIIHARFLKIKKKIVSREITVPKNLTPLKVGKPDEKAERYEPCKFETIAIDKTIIFDKGKKTQKVTHPKEAITKTVFFEIDSSLINAEGNTKVNNVLQFLLEHEHSTITIDGYACVIGKENYNNILSQKRSDAVKKMFINGGLEAQRIISKGHGEINATDDKMGRDNIKYKDTREYIDARRVDISFVFNGHDAQTIVYETIAPSHNKNLTIDITEYQNKACFREKEKHQKKIMVSSPEYDKPLKKEGVSLAFPVHSSLSILNPAPMQYIWPKWNLTKIAGVEKSIDSATNYSIHVHSCRYYSNDKNATVIVKAYPDIKWELAFELKLDVENYSHTNMPSEHSIFEKHQKKAREDGYKRWLMNKEGKVPIKIGVGLKAEWNEGKQKLDVTKDFEKKIESTAKILAKSVDIVQNAINVCRGVMKATSIPVSFGVEYPKFEAVGSWNLQREANYLNIAVVGEINFAAKPLIGANATIDLIAAAVTAVSYGTTGSPAISKIVNEIRGYGKVVGAEISAEAKFYGQLEVMVEALKINSITGIKGGSLTIGGKMGVIIKIKVSAGNDLNIKKLEVKFKFSAEAKAHAYFGGDFKIDSDDKGVFIEPILKFSGVKVSLDVKVEVGWFTRSFAVEDDIIPADKIPLGKKYINN